MHVDVPGGATGHCRTSSQCPYLRESVIAGVYFNQMSTIYFCLRFSCCPYYWGVRYSVASPRRELTVFWNQASHRERFFVEVMFK